jgi:hypothetical protein
MLTSQISKLRWRVAAVSVAGCCLVVSGCSDDGNDPNDPAPGTLANGEETDLPDSSLDVSDGSGEGGNRSGEGGSAPGAPAP